MGSVTSKVSFHWCAVVRLLTGALVTGCLPFNTYAGALEESVNNPRIDEIVTTGVRERPLAELPRSANIITAEDIALSPAANARLSGCAVISIPAITSSTAEALVTDSPGLLTATL